MGTTVVNKNGVEFDIDAIASDLNMKLEKDLTNITDSGKAKCAGYPMPSSTYVDLTLGASGTSYTAPANGWYAFSKAASTSGQYVVGVSGGIHVLDSGATGATPRIAIPVAKGESCIISYTASGATNFFRFVYAEGSVSEAS